MIDKIKGGYLVVRAHARLVIPNCFLAVNMFVLRMLNFINLSKIYVLLFSIFHTIYEEYDHC